MEKSATIWCKKGDWVLTGKYVGLKFKYEGEEYSIINDDEVVAIVPDPEKITHKQTCITIQFSVQYTRIAVNAVRNRRRSR